MRKTTTKQTKMMTNYKMSFEMFQLIYLFLYIVIWSAKTLKCSGGQDQSIGCCARKVK